MDSCRRALCQVDTEAEAGPRAKSALRGATRAAGASLERSAASAAADELADLREAVAEGERARAALEAEVTALGEGGAAAEVLQLREEVGLLE